MWKSQKGKPLRIFKRRGLKCPPPFRLANLRQEASSLSCSKKSRSPLRLSLRAEIPWSDHRTRCTKKRAFLCILHDRPKAIAMGPSHVFLMNNVKGFVKSWEPAASNKWQVMPQQMKKPEDFNRFRTKTKIYDYMASPILPFWRDIT